MMEHELYYNLSENRWAMLNENFCTGKEIEDIPIVIVMEYEANNYIWCKKHGQFELLQEFNGLEWQTDSCKMKGIPACFSCNNDKSEFPHHLNINPYNHQSCYAAKIPVRWRLNIQDKKPLV